MTSTLTIRDEKIGGGEVHEFSLDFLTEKITVEELIRSRVYQEVKDYNAQENQKPNRAFRGLVRPTDAEESLNGYRLKKPRQINWKLQFEKAIEAFNHNQILILVNDRQVESLDEEIEIRTDSVVSFVRLTMLVGG